MRVIENPEKFKDLLVTRNVDIVTHWNTND